MPKITYIHPDGTTSVIDVPIGETVMRGAKLNGVNGIVAQCGGGASCGTCHVYVDDIENAVLPPMHGVEDEILHETASPRQQSSRLSCQLPVTDDLDGLVVHLPETQL